MALGARPRNILALALKQGVLLTGIGVVVGLIAALVLTRLMTSLLFGVTSTDPITYLGVSALLAGVAIFAMEIEPKFDAWEGVADIRRISTPNGKTRNWRVKTVSQIVS